MTQDPNHRTPEVEVVSDEHYLNLEDGEGLFGHKFKQRLKVVLTENLLTFYIEHLVVERKFWFGKKSDCWYSSRATVVPLWLVDLIATRATKPDGDSVTDVEKVGDEFIKWIDTVIEECENDLSSPRPNPNTYSQMLVYQVVRVNYIEKALRSQPSLKAQGVDEKTLETKAYELADKILGFVDKPLANRHSKTRATVYLAFKEFSELCCRSLPTPGVESQSVLEGAADDFASWFEADNRHFKEVVMSSVYERGIVYLRRLRKALSTPPSGSVQDTDIDKRSPEKCSFCWGGPKNTPHEHDCPDYQKPTTKDTTEEE